MGFLQLKWKVILIFFAVAKQPYYVNVSCFVCFQPLHDGLLHARMLGSSRDGSRRHEATSRRNHAVVLKHKTVDSDASDNRNATKKNASNGMKHPSTKDDVHHQPQQSSINGGGRSRKSPHSNKEDAIISLNLSLRALAKSKERGSARRAEQLLLRVEKLHRDGYYSRKPDIVSYNTVMDAWARSGEKDSAKRAELLLQRMEELKSTNQNSIKPNTRSYNTVINAFAKASSSQPGSAARAKELLEQMEEMYRISSSTTNRSSSSSKNYNAVLVKPDTITYNCVLDALAKAKDCKNAVDDAEKLLKKMKKLHKDGDLDVCPNSRSVGSVIHALANQPSSTPIASAQRALDLLREMEYEFKAGNSNMMPTLYTYNMVISCLSKCAFRGPGAVEQAEKLLQKLEHLSSLADGAWAYLKPNVVTYSSVLNCYAKSELRDKAQRAEELLMRMEERYKNRIDLSIKPDTIAYSTVLLCWANSKDDNAAVNAERLLYRMENLNAEGNSDVRPNEKCYSAVISAWAKSQSADAAQRAESILQRMEYMYESGISNSLPNTICCNAVLNCYAKSDLPDKAQRAAYLIQRMNEQHQLGIQQDVKADIISYNCLLNACATTDGYSNQCREALEIALVTFKMLYQSKACTLTSHTYASVLKAFGALVEMGDERIRLMKTAFRLCCEEGQVDKPVLQELQRALPAELCNQLLRGYVINGKPDVEAIPFGWKRNIENSTVPLE